MKKHPVVAKKHPISSQTSEPREREGELVDVRDARAARLGFFGLPFVSFSYSYTEITAGGGRARVKAQRTRYEHARLESERFEGELDPDQYHRAVAEAQRQFAEHASGMMRSVLSLFPVLGKSRSRGG